MEGKVIKKNANIFTIESEGKIFELKPSGKTKGDGIYVGDDVVFDQTITSVKQRKNILIRPPMANIDKLFIICSCTPKPDFVLIDKLFVYAFFKNITPVLVVNKMDIADKEFAQEIEKTYSKVAKIIYVSAKLENIKDLLEEIEGVCAFAGQSGVGKSSLINALCGKNETEVGDLSSKLDRGKQTTRIVNLYKFEKGYLADTAGFSKLDLNMISNIEKDDLARFYPDFIEGRALCKYRSCLHENGDCGIIKLVKSGDISKNRYQNYLKILEEIKNYKKY
jgi:ribosome biogenesis GTPase